MKKILMFATVAFVFAAIAPAIAAPALSQVAKRVHDSSSGKLIAVGDGVIRDAADSALKYEGGRNEAINELCDLSKQWQISSDGRAFYLYCIAK